MPMAAHPLISVNGYASVIGMATKALPDRERGVCCTLQLEVPEEAVPARIAAEHRGAYEVWSRAGSSPARLAGRLRLELGDTIKAVLPGSPAARAGIKAGDVLVINTSATLKAALRIAGTGLELHLSTRLPEDRWVVEKYDPVEKAGPAAPLARPGEQEQERPVGDAVERLRDPELGAHAPSPVLSGGAAAGRRSRARPWPGRPARA